MYSAKKSKLQNLWKNPKYIKQLNTIKLQIKFLSQISLKCSIFALLKIIANVVFFVVGRVKAALAVHTLAMPLNFSIINYGPLGWGSELSDMILSGHHSRTIPVRFWLK